LAHDLLAVIRVYQLEPACGLDPRFPRESEDLRHQWSHIAELDPQLLPVVDLEAVRNHRPELGELAEPLLRLGRLAFGIQSSGQVDQDSLEEERLASRVAREHRGAIEHLDDPAALVEVAVLHLEGIAGPAAAFPGVRDRVVIMWMEPAHPYPIVAPLGRREPE